MRCTRDRKSWKRSWWLLSFSVTIMFLAVVGQSAGQSSTSSLGTLYADNSNAGTLTAINLNGGFSGTIAIGGSPEGLVCGPDNGVYVALSGIFGGNRQIIRVNPDLSGSPSVVVDFASTPALMNSGGPEGPSFGPSKELFFGTRAAEGFAHTGAWRLPAPGATPVQVALPFACNSEAGCQNNEQTTFSSASRLGVDRDFLAADPVNARIVRLAPEFSSALTAVTFITGVSVPNGLATSRVGNIYVAEFGAGGSIRKFTRTGTSLGIFATIPNSNALKLAFDALDNLYVALFGGQIVEITPGGVMSTVASVGVQGNGVAVCPNVVITITPSSISLSKTSAITVAMLSGSTLPAPTVVDSRSLTFGQTGNEASLLSCKSQDVDGDGTTDLVCTFSTKVTDLQLGSLVGTLRGRLLNGTWFQATGPVSIVP